jgi:hypothetical protein
LTMGVHRGFDGDLGELVRRRLAVAAFWYPKVLMVHLMLNSQSDYVPTLILWDEIVKLLRRG